MADAAVVAVVGMVGVEGGLLVGRFTPTPPTPPLTATICAGAPTADENSAPGASDEPTVPVAGAVGAAVAGCAGAIDAEPVRVHRRKLDLLNLPARSDDAGHLRYLRNHLHLRLYNRTERLHWHVNGLIHGLPVRGRYRHLYRDGLLHRKLDDLWLTICGCPGSWGAEVTNVFTGVPTGAVPAVPGAAAVATCTGVPSAVVRAFS
uniref:Uncharacterized protein n=1 Tax=Anopheles farauti TaxID=69004 RepID=A0A182QQG2_9DIPT